eukprot:CAMPEP_0168506606 /NCGR_PEP_ID=MMETSP0228-20121227/77460_1 /TAXON_ID=133427 /ORGANISM="Protoceratium reticulatum, Strain CCCM 535 (=CCMP 1889)" /LENGTH=78 /DNA_ID=CAMNT_0008523703 /DNA_START=178 /DNA_END=414 /DNA_ORIENTATION=-
MMGFDFWKSSPRGFLLKATSRSEPSGSLKPMRSFLGPSSSPAWAAAGARGSGSSSRLSSRLPSGPSSGSSLNVDFSSV